MRLVRKFENTLRSFWQNWQIFAENSGDVTSWKLKNVKKLFLFLKKIYNKQFLTYCRFLGEFDNILDLSLKNLNQVHQIDPNILL